LRGLLAALLLVARVVLSLVLLRLLLAWPPGLPKTP
jgi:hypothetical protein